jgi:anti-sigma factor RsiW
MADYLESALTPEVIAELEAHLEGCEPCVAYLRTYRRTKDLTAQTERVEMPEEMTIRLRRFLLDKPPVEVRSRAVSGLRDGGPPSGA